MVSLLIVLVVCACFCVALWVPPRFLKWYVSPLLGLIAGITTFLILRLFG